MHHVSLTTELVVREAEKTKRFHHKLDLKKKICKFDNQT
jgi:hypothetical protein